jgi:hypothetical protein
MDKTKSVSGILGAHEKGANSRSTSPLRQVALVFTVIVATAVLCACRGGSSPSAATSSSAESPPPASAATRSNQIIEVSVSGLISGTIVELTLNGTTTRAWIQRDGTYPYPPNSALPVGATYSVTIDEQPLGQICTITDNAGTITSSPPAIALVTCAAATASPPSTNASALLVNSEPRMPPARQGASHWTDSTGNMWLFGGQGLDSSAAIDTLNDLWKFTSSEGWQQVQPSKEESSMTPPATSAGRSFASTWVDATGLWLFGGQGRSAAGAPVLYNDLWKFSNATSEWTHVDASLNAPISYAADGAPSNSNVPGRRSNAASWVDSTGNLLLFGGYGVDSTGATGMLNDLWEFTPATGSWARTAGMTSTNTIH